MLTKRIGTHPPAAAISHHASPAHQRVLADGRKLVGVAAHQGADVVHTLLQRGGRHHQVVQLQLHHDWCPRVWLPLAGCTQGEQAEGTAAGWRRQQRRRRQGAAKETNRSVACCWLLISTCWSRLRWGGPARLLHWRLARQRCELRPWARPAAVLSDLCYDTLLMEGPEPHLVQEHNLRVCMGMSACQAKGLRSPTPSSSLIAFVHLAALSCPC